MGFQDSKSNIYGDDGSTSTQAVLVGIGTDLYVASDGRPKAVISKACKDDDSTASATVLGGTQLLAKVFNSQAIVLSEAGKGETCQSTEMGILESGSNTYDDDDSTASDRVLGGTRLVAKFVGSKPGIYLAADEGETCQVCSLDSESNTSLYDGLAAEEAISLGTDIVSQSVIPMAGEGETCQTTDVCSLDSESNTHQDDDSTGGSQEFEGETYRRTKMDILESENNTHIQCEPFPRTDMDSERDTCRYDGLATKEANSFCTDIVSQAVIPMAGKGETHQRTKMDILESESNTYLDDGSTSTDKGILVSENNTCHVDVSTSYIMVSDSRGSPAVKSNADKGQPDFHGAQAVELILKDFKGGPYPRTDMGFLRFDGLTTKEAISLCIDLSVSPMSGKGEIYQRTKMDSESNTYVDDGSTGKGFIAKVDGFQAVISSKVVKGQPDSHGCQAVILKEGKGEPDSHGSQVAILKEAISNAGKGEPYQRTDMDSESNTSCYDGLVTEKAISLCSDIFSQAVKPMSGEDGHLVGGNVVVAAVIALSGKAQPSSMESLPSDIVQEIISWVPAESVLECKLVCKKWVTLIRGSNFANMHFSRQLNHLYDGDEGDDNLAAKVDPCLFFACRIDDPDKFISLLFHGGQASDKIRNDGKYIYNQNLKRIYHPPMHNEPLYDHLVGSCNGLVCAFQQHHIILDPIYICNPLTREYVYLPQLVVKKEDIDPDDSYRIVEGEVDMFGDVACGFGYVRSTNEYKVVRIHYLNYDGHVEVYTLGSGCGWRATGEVPYRLDASYGGMGTYAHGAIYWTSYNKVVAFDLGDEKVRLLSAVPPRMENRRNGGDRIGLVALGRHLCIYIDDRLRHVEIWSLMKSRETWRMEFDIDYEAIPGARHRELQPISLAQNGEIVLVYSDSVLYSYDPKTRDLKMISNEASTDNFDAVEAIAHINTFASLEAMGENSKRYTVCSPLDDVIGDLDRVALGEGIDTTRFRLG